MTEEQIQYSIETGVLKLGFWDRFTHYEIVVYCLFIPAMTIIFHFIYHSENTNRSAEILSIIIPCIVAALFYLLQKKRLKFTEIYARISRERLDLVIAEVARELKWVPVIVNQKGMIFKTFPPFFSGSWGEQITILFDSERILINSICDPGKRSSIASMGRNTQNINRLIKAVREAEEIAR